jgi:hypothetical protein
MMHDPTASLIRQPSVARAFPATGPPKEKPAHLRGAGKGFFSDFLKPKQGQYPMTKPSLQAVDPTTPATPAPDPFDLTSLRLNPSFLETAGVEKVWTTVP